MTISWLDFAFACAAMGIGIGMDVALATLARAQQLIGMKSIIMWVLGVSLTHTLFPMLGYLMTYFSVQVLPPLTPIVGVIAALCIFWFFGSDSLYPRLKPGMVCNHVIITDKFRNVDGQSTSVERFKAQ